MSWTPTQEQLDGMGPRDRVTSHGIERCVRGVDPETICGCGLCQSERVLTFTHGDTARPTQYDDGTPLMNFTEEGFHALGVGIRIETPLKTVRDAKRFIYALASAGMQWHLDDDVEDNMFPELSDLQRTQLGYRRDELFALLPDPHDIAIDAMHMGEAFDDTIHVPETDHDCHNHVVHRVDETSRLGDYYECGHCHALLQVG